VFKLAKVRNKSKRDITHIRQKRGCDMTKKRYRNKVEGLFREAAK